MWAMPESLQKPHGSNFRNGNITTTTALTWPRCGVLWASAVPGGKGPSQSKRGMVQLRGIVGSSHCDPGPLGEASPDR